MSKDFWDDWYKSVDPFGLHDRDNDGHYDFFERSEMDWEEQYEIDLMNKQNNSSSFYDDNCDDDWDCDEIDFDDCDYEDEYEGNLCGGSRNYSDSVSSVCQKARSNTHTQPTEKKQIAIPCTKSDLIFGFFGVIVCSFPIIFLIMMLVIAVFAVVCGVGDIDGGTLALIDGILSASISVLLGLELLSGAIKEDKERKAQLKENNSTKEK